MALVAAVQSEAGSPRPPSGALQPPGTGQHRSAARDARSPDSWKPVLCQHMQRIPQSSNLWGKYSDVDLGLLCLSFWYGDLSTSTPRHDCSRTSENI